MNPTAIITGASRGIGLGIATRLADQGYGLTISARDPERLASTAELLRNRGAKEVVAVSGDLSQPQAAAEVVNAHRAQFEGLSALVLNAGVGTAGALGEFEMRRFDKAIDINLRTPLALLQQSLPLLRQWAAENPVRGAKVIALSSMTGIYTEAGLSVYGATKAALATLIDAVNLEESAHGVSATAIAPGYVDTDMAAWTHDRIAPESMITVDDIVELADTLLRLSARAVVPAILVSRAGTDGRHA